MLQSLGRYEIIRVLGRGGFAVVYLARDSELHREVALKVPRLDRFATAADADLFVEEARKAAQLDHRGIVRIHDVQREPRVYIVQQFLPGGDLSQYVRNQRTTVRRVVELLVSIAEALAHAHRLRYTHLDLKPANILLDDEGQPHIADFGLALHESAQRERSGQIAGTLPYMSPEQSRGEVHRLDGRSDLWSLGVIFYELLTGTLPFSGGNREQLFDEIRHRDPRPPRQVDPSLPAEVSRICLTCLAKRASDRYQSAADLIDDLNHWLHSTGSHGFVGQSERQSAGSVERSATAGNAIVPKGLRSFDAADASFYLQLLPGPHDREGIPKSVRFWKTQLEQRDGDATFQVGLMYGPSGCGKSSLVKAGIIPRLNPDVIPLYVEATGMDLEVRLLKALRKHCRDSTQDLALPELVMNLRHHRGVQGRKVVLLIDQFEQWLHTHQARDDSQLIPALRQCDGVTVQCVVLVRDDFQVAVNRFFQALEVPLVEGHNSALVDLFDTDHARHVLLRFGRAYGKLPEAPEDLAPQQADFLVQAIAGLAENRHVVSVRLAVFAEMMKSRPWTKDSLREVGGAEGIGASFLEDTFCSRTAPPAHRFHETAARNLLAALLPDQGMDIKGKMKSYEDLVVASGYDGRASDIESLLNILDGELRLITPTEPDESSSGRYYQLTHDFLVPSLREWLTRKQRETRRGRAELQLAERSTVWNRHPENRHLPSLLEYGSICLLTNRRHWLATQQKMMSGAHRYYLTRSAALVILATLFISLSWYGWRVMRDHQRLEYVDARIAALVQREPNEIESIVEQLRDYPEISRRQLSKAFDGSQSGAPGKLASTLALLSFTPTAEHVAYLYRELANCSKERCDAICTRLANYLKPLEASAKRELWTAARLAASDVSQLTAGCKRVFTQSLATKAATRFLEYLEVLRPNDAEVSEWAEQLLKSTYPEFATVEMKEQHASQRANAAILMLHSGTPDKVWPLLRQRSEPHARGYLIARISGLKVPSALLVARLREIVRDSAGHDQSIVTSLLLCIGHYRPEEIATSTRNKLRTSLVSLFRDTEDAGIHSAAEWVLRQWKQEKLLEEMKQALAQSVTGSPIPSLDRKWYVNSQRQTLAVLPGRQFTMGSPTYEAGREKDEWQHQRQITRHFAIGTTEVTRGQWDKFAKAKQAFPTNSSKVDRDFIDRYSPSPTCPMIAITWYEAVWYCNWLSEKEGIDKSQWCYDPNAAGEYASGMKTKANFLSLTGYRLPTEPEWEYAARSGTTTSRYYGDYPDLLDQYAWYLRSSDKHANPVGQLIPNDFGMFDVLGNVFEFCQDPVAAYPKRSRLARMLGQTRVFSGAPPTGVVKENDKRCLRGAAFDDRSSNVRCADRFECFPGQRNYNYGFRIARTIAKIP